MEITTLESLELTDDGRSSNDTNSRQNQDGADYLGNCFTNVFWKKQIQTTAQAEKVPAVGQQPARYAYDEA